MKKLIIAAAVLALSAGVNAEEKAGGQGVKVFGGLTVETLAAAGITGAVALAIISNNRGSNIDIDEEVILVCNEGDGNPVNGVCTNNSTTVTVTGTGTNTSTTTVPVVTTYVAYPKV